MKSVLISIRPKWCEKIASGKKTVEVRKTKPKCETPFKCYIYCTKSPFELIRDTKGRITLLLRGKNADISDLVMLSGNVIGEFICNAIDAARANNGVQTYYNIPNGTCLTDEQLIKYAAGKTLYLWHISDLKFYDHPKELNEFKGRKLVWRGNNHIHEYEEITRPPQSWCYVEHAEVNGI